MTTTEGLTVPSLEEGRSRPTGKTADVVPVVAACAFCRRRLANEYFFTCRKCDASYCYIHMSRHQPAPCARQVARRLRARAAASATSQGEGAPVQRRGQLLLAGTGSHPNSSANV